LESSYLHFNEEGWRGRSLVFRDGLAVLSSSNTWCHFDGADT